MADTKRNALCTAALELFAEQGIESTTIQEIAERAGAAEGTLYRHFQGKRELVRWLFDRSARRFRDMLLTEVSEEMPPWAQLRGLIRGVFTFAETDPAAFTYLLSVHHTGILESFDEPPAPMRLFNETMEAGIEEGAFRTLPPSLATGWVVAMAQRAVVFLESDLVSAPRTEVVEHTVDAALRLVDANCDR